ncbi:MAG: phage tail sheath family protein [Chloroflexi bacterium]|nr:phage tail sheath family protein [Chloroflexota bacterium]
MSPSYLSPGVYVEEIPSGSKPIEGVGTAVAAFIGFTEKGPVGQPTLVTNWSQFTKTFGEFIDGGFLAHSVYGYFNNGGGICYVTRLPGEIGGNGKNGSAEAKALPAPRAALPSRAAAALPSLEFTAQDAGATDISVEVRAPEAGAPDDQFTLAIKRGSTEELFSNVTLGKGKGVRNVVDVVNKESKLVTVAEREATGSLLERAPALGTYSLARVEASVPATKAPALPPAKAGDYIGDAAARTGINGLEVADIVTMVCVPDLMAAYMGGQISEENMRAVQTAMMDHCASMRDRVAILDCPPGLSPQQIRDWRMNVAGYDSKYAALYYPWIKVANPKGGDPILVPPSGHLAGLWARVDGERGVHKAPANEIVRGAIGLEVQISRNEQDTLNPIGVNCIRSFPGRGIRVWGARTISSDPEWRYLNVRRLFNYVEKSIENGTQWVVFEPNDMDLWERVKRNVSAFLTRVWADGALFGATPAEAFFVKCDGELNTQEVRDAGQLIVEIGIAPVKPAEFVIFRISQYTPGA